MARWLRVAPQVLVLDEPTQGVDVGSKADIHRLVDEAAAGGAAVVVCSTDTDELARLATEVVVLRRGRVAAELAGDDIETTADRAGAAAARPTPTGAADRADGRNSRRERHDHRRPSPPSPSGADSRLPGLQKASALYLLGFILVLFGLWIPETFLTQTTFKLVLADQVVIAILGLALLIPLTAGAFDLSVGAMLAFSLVIVSWFEAEHRPATACISCLDRARGLRRRRVPVRPDHRALPRQLVHRHARHEPGARRGDAVHLGEQADHRRVLGLVPRVRPRATCSASRSSSTTSSPSPSCSGTCSSARHSAGTCSPPAPTPRPPGCPACAPTGMVWGSLVASAVVAGIAGIIYGAKIGSFSNTFGAAAPVPGLRRRVLRLDAVQVAAERVGDDRSPSTPSPSASRACSWPSPDGVYWITPLFNGLALIAGRRPGQPQRTPPRRRRTSLEADPGGRRARRLRPRQRGRRLQPRRARRRRVHT